MPLDTHVICERNGFVSGGIIVDLYTTICYSKSVEINILNYEYVPVYILMRAMDQGQRYSPKGQYRKGYIRLK